MKIRLFLAFISLTILLALTYQIDAQQDAPQRPAPYWGQTMLPFMDGRHSVPPSQANSQRQGYNPQGIPESRRLQNPSDLPPVSRRYCQGVISARRPYPPIRTVVPTQPRTIPVQGLWPGSLSGKKVQKDGNLQPVDAQTGNVQQDQVPAGDPASAYPGRPFYEPLSTIEGAFQEIPSFAERSSKQLQQYGYSLFASPISTFAPIDDVPVGPDYILGPGDNLTINIWGAMEKQLLRTVDRNGQLILPSVGPLRVWGLTFNQADRLIREQLSRYYRGFKTSVTMGRLRTIRVYVVGEVCQPGSFTLSSLSTVTNALFSAGGPMKLGSLRKIELKRNHHTVGTIDLYDFLLRGDKTHDFRLQSGDTIFVPPVGPVAAITGEVKRPAIYELRGENTVRDLIEMAGGLTPRSYLKRVQVIRAKPNAERELIDLDLTGIGTNGDSPRNIVLTDGDHVRIYPTDPRIYNTVRLEGAVIQPGEYELKPGMRLSQLLPKERLLPEAYVDRVEIARLKNFTTNILSLDLRKAWAGDKRQDILLQRLDLISVRSNFKAPGTVKLEGEIIRPGSYRIKRGERLSSVLKRAGGYTDNAFFKGAVFTRRTVEKIERRRLEEFVQRQEQAMLADTAADTKQKPQLRLRREQLKLLVSKVVLGRVVIRLVELDKFEGLINDVVLEDGDVLRIPTKPVTVLVLGSVRNPTAVLHKEDKDVRYYLNRAGGLSPNAAEKEIYLLKADGSAIAGFMKLRDIDPGDVIITPPDTTIRTDKLELTKALATIAGSVAIGLAGLVAIF